MRYRSPAPSGPVPEQSAAGADLRPLSEQEKQRLATGLNAEERRVMLSHGTEPPFCGGLLDNKLDGVYHCRLCDLPLFSSEHKFNSGTGWPSFYQAVDPHHVRYLDDHSHGMSRIEIRCQRCDGHLGHVFPDGPPPTGWRYCVNSVSLRFFAEARRS